MASYEIGAHDAHRSRQTVANRLLDEAGISLQPEVRLSSLIDVPGDLWLRIFSYLDVITLLHPCALVCRTWLEFVYEVTGKHLSFTGERICKHCEQQRVWKEWDIESTIRYLAKRVGSLESIGLDFRVIKEGDLDMLCHILAACKNLKSVSILGGSEFNNFDKVWKTLPDGLTTLRISDGELSMTSPLQLDKLKELYINGSALADLCSNVTNKPDEILCKLEALTVHNMHFKQLPAPKVLGSLTQLSIPAGGRYFIKGSSFEFVNFVMGLEKLRSLTINLERQRRERIYPGNLRKLQQHPSLQEIRLIGKGTWVIPGLGSVPLTKELCSFLATEQLKVLSLNFKGAGAEIAVPIQEPFRGTNFSASGLRQVALQFDVDQPNLDLSDLISAPNLEQLELVFPWRCISNLDLSLRVAQGRHKKPFSIALVSSKIYDKTIVPITLPLDWLTLEQGFGPQDYTNWACMRAALHQPLVEHSGRRIKRIYCNSAYTAAARAQTPRLAATLQNCEIKLGEEWLCGSCKVIETGLWLV